MSAKLFFSNNFILIIQVAPFEEITQIKLLVGNQKNTSPFVAGNFKNVNNQSCRLIASYSNIPFIELNKPIRFSTHSTKLYEIPPSRQFSLNSEKPNIVDFQSPAKVNLFIQSIYKTFPALSPETLSLIENSLLGKSIPINSESEITTLFDKEFYLKQISNINEIDDPLQHYLDIGGFQGYQPNAFFDSSYYLNNDPNLLSEKFNPLLHYIQYGKTENRRVNPQQVLLQDINKKKLQLIVKQKYVTAFINKQKIKLNKNFNNIDFDKLILIFNQKSYLKDFADIKKALKKKKLDNALAHYTKIGCVEIAKNQRKIHILKGNMQQQKITNCNTKNCPQPRLFPVDAKTMKSNSPLQIPAFKKPLVSIIIPAYNQAFYTYSCIQAIVENTKNIAYEIIVMDDNSSQTLAYKLDDYILNVRLYQNKKNIGFINNCNIGARRAKGSYLLFLNNDTNVQSNWLEPMLKLFKSDKQVGIVGSKLIYPDGRLQEAGGIIWRNGSGCNYGQLKHPENPEYNYLKEVDYISGASLLISKKLWHQLKGFDTHYQPAYYEDSDLAFKARSMGYKVMYQPQSVVVHYEGISNGTDTHSGIKAYQVKNQSLFRHTWKKQLKQSHQISGEKEFLARDRSQSKQRLLFIDHYLPHYDQDAGSKVALQYLEFFNSRNFQIYFIGDNFFHYPGTPYLETLQQLGIEVLYGKWYQKHWKDWVKQNGQYLDYIILSRPHISEKYIRTVKKHTRAKIVYLAHDLHFLREYRAYQLTKKSEHFEASQTWQKKEIALMKKMHMSYVFSDAEKRVLQKIDKTLKVDIVPLYIYRQFKETSYKPEKREHLLFVGGFNHLPNVDAIKWFAKGIWPLIKQKIPKLKIYIVGSNPPKTIRKLASKDIIVTGFVEDKKLEKLYQQTSLVVAPLRYGAGVKGKIVDAMYHSMPVVTTDIGIEGLIDARQAISVANSAKEFAHIIVELLDNKKLLKQKSALSFRYCQEYFSAPYAQKQLSPIFKELVKKRSKIN